MLKLKKEIKIFYFPSYLLGRILKSTYFLLADYRHPNRNSLLCNKFNLLQNKETTQIQFFGGKKWEKKITFFGVFYSFCICSWISQFIFEHCFILVASKSPIQKNEINWMEIFFYSFQKLSFFCFTIRKILFCPKRKTDHSA